MTRLHSYTLMCLMLILFILMGCEPLQRSTFDEPGYELISDENSSIAWAVKTNDKGTIIEKGMLLDGVRHGSWTYYDPTKNGVPELIQHYIDGQLYGAAISIDPSGKAYDIKNYADSLLYGDQIKLKSGWVGETTPYAHGQKEGIFRSYFANGQIQQEVPYHKDRIHGQLKYFNTEGQVTVEYTYENGEKVSGGMTQ